MFSHKDRASKSKLAAIDAKVSDYQNSIKTKIYGFNLKGYEL